MICEHATEYTSMRSREHTVAKTHLQRTPAELGPLFSTFRGTGIGFPLTPRARDLLVRGGVGRRPEEEGRQREKERKPRGTGYRGPGGRFLNCPCNIRTEHRVRSADYASRGQEIWLVQARQMAGLS